MNNLRKVCAALFLLLFTTFHLYSFAETITPKYQILNHPVLRTLRWTGLWVMFTYKSGRHKTMTFEAYQNEEWKRLPMEEWYPTKWESGYRWERRPVYASKSRQLPFAHAACERSGSSAVRIVMYQWRKTVGQKEQPMENPRTTVLNTFRCEDIERYLPSPRII